MGGEYQFLRSLIYASYVERGRILINGPAPPNVEALFPVWNNPSTWNVAALSPPVTTFTQSIGGPTTGHSPHFT
jgi:hypothetical protein